MDRFLTVNEAAKMAKMRPLAIREMFREKRLRAFKVGNAWRTTEKMLREDIAAMAGAGRPAPSQKATVDIFPPVPELPPDGRPIWERIAELAAELPDAMIASLPSDGATQLDHYLYGAPRRTP
jgi:hypothetical protein